jgi:TPR repeat protein
VRCYAEASELGVHESQHRLGVILANGEGGVPVDLPRAVRWWTAAAEAGNAKAMLALGELYAYGGGAEQHQRGRVPADRAAALTWLRRAAAAEDDELTAAIAAQAVEKLEKPAGGLE